MDFDNVKETLTHKYGPLPGYAWAGIGAGAIVLIVKIGGAKKGAASGPVTVSPLSAGGLDTGGGGGGGGGGLDLGGDTGDGGVTGSDGGVTGDPTGTGAPIGTAPLVEVPTSIQTAPLPGHNATVDSLVASQFVPVSANGLPAPYPGTLETDGGLFTAPVSTQGVYNPTATITALVDASGHVVSPKGTRVGGATAE